MPRPLLLSDQLRERLRTCKKTMYTVSQQTGVAEGTLSRFLGRKRNLSQKATNAIGQYLWLDLMPSHLALSPEENLEEALKKSVKHLVEPMPTKKKRQKR